MSSWFIAWILLTTMFFSRVQCRSIKIGSDSLKKVQASFVPRTDTQRQYVEYLRNPNVSLVVAVGCAGTGKTLFACKQAVQALRRGDVDRIVLTRPIVPVLGEDGLGFLPGTLARKMDPWTRPMYDILNLWYDVKEIQTLFNEQKIETVPLALMRGRTFHRTFVVADEMQNSSPGQMLMLLTRMGEGGKLVVTGDEQQTDRADTRVPVGLTDLMQRLQQVGREDSRIRWVKLGTEDVQRSALVSEVMNLYAKELDVVPLLVHTEESKKALQDCALIPDDPFLRNKMKMKSKK